MLSSGRRQKGELARLPNLCADMHMMISEQLSGGCLQGMNVLLVG